ncbi:MAG: hypothetical protein NTU78_06490, partial [Alphaproteobacteria bacterium]|nr:hypothetical protein [Alphaproteobacteria bacterium]
MLSEDAPCLVCTRQAENSSVWADGCTVAPGWRLDMMRRYITNAVFLAGLLAATATAESDSLIQGTATVIDGDTIEIHGQRIRLDAIDAPEGRQQCQKADETSYPCGRRSAFA